MNKVKDDKPGRKPRTSTVPPNETKAEKFKRLGVARVGKAIKALQSVTQLAGKGYECTDEQAEKVQVAIGNAFTALREAFENRNKAKAASAPIIEL